jgi:hypothetical protein
MELEVTVDFGSVCVMRMPQPTWVLRDAGTIADPDAPVPAGRPVPSPRINDLAGAPGRSW